MRLHDVDLPQAVIDAQKRGELVLFAGAGVSIDPPSNYPNFLDLATELGGIAYTKHPEAKSLAPDGTSCACDTRGLLQRSSVTAASRRYVGKETDRRWEQGEDLSLVEFTSCEYQQSKQVVASDEIKQQILQVGIRKLERATGVSHHTIAKILSGEQVRRNTLAKIVK
ncbi:MAG: hypothetical protein WA416_05770 [Candidatus Sulfotelmatobacter sp.]